MSNRVKGIVRYINEKEWDDRRSGETIMLYSFKLDGDDDYYRTGQTKPEFEEGQSIAFEVDNKNNVDLETVEVLEAEVKKAPKATGRPAKSGGFSKNASGSAGGRDEYWAKKEARDLEKDARYQKVDIPRMTFCTSQDAAVSLVTAALQHDCLPKIGTVSKTARLSALLAYVDEITDRFFRQRMGAATEVSEETETEEEGSDDNDTKERLDD